MPARASPAGDTPSDNASSRSSDLISWYAICLDGAAARSRGVSGAKERVRAKLGAAREDYEMSLGGSDLNGVNMIYLMDIIGIRYAMLSHGGSTI